MHIQNKQHMPHFIVNDVRMKNHLRIIVIMPKVNSDKNNDIDTRHTLRNTCIKLASHVSFRIP